MPGTYRDLQPQVTLGGNALDNVISFHWSLGYDQAVGTASVVCATEPGGDYYDEVNIVVDGVVRWSGLLYSVDRTLYPRSISLNCKGRLQLASDYKLQQTFTPEEKGLKIADLTGTDSATDEQIVSAVFNRIGESLGPGGSIEGTGTVLGTVAPDAFVWSVSDTALSYIQKIDSVSLGYRTFESAAGAIFRRQISSRPTGSPDYEFTEGVDIVDGSSSRTVEDAYGAIHVGGYSVGDYLDPRVWFVSAGGPVARTFSFSSEMIERRADSSPGLGLSTESVANYWLSELNREFVKVSLKTPRSDVFGPGQIHRVTGLGGGEDRLGVSETLWLQRCDGELRSDGGFSQSLQYLGGGPL